MGLTPETLMQLGLYDYVWGDNWYPKAMQAAEEAEKNREAQRAYNDYLKEYDRAKAVAEQSAAYKKELKEAEVEMASLNRDLVKANPPDAAVILKRQEALIAKYPELKSVDTSAAKKANDAERAYQAEKTGYISEMPTSFKTVDEQRLAIEDVMKSNLRAEDKEKAVAELRSIKPLSLQQTEASQSAVASHAGKKTGESLDEADLAAKANDAIKSNKSPSRLTSEVLDKIRELNYTWKNNKWSKR